MMASKIMTNSSGSQLHCGNVVSLPIGRNAIDWFLSPMNLKSQYLLYVNILFSGTCDGSGEIPLTSSSHNLLIFSTLSTSESASSTDAVRYC